MNHYMDWEGDKVNSYFIKLFDHINTNYAENKRPRSEFFNRMRIIDHAYKDFYHECACYSWTKEKLVDRVENLLNNKDFNSEFNYSDYEADFKKSELYLTTIHQLSEKFKVIINNYSFNFTNPVIQHIS